MESMKRHIGGSIFPSNSHQVLQPVETKHGMLQVRVIEEEDTHGLFDVRSGALLAEHPNGYSCYALAVCIRDGRKAKEQGDYIVACGGVVTDAGRAKIKGAV